MNIGIYIYDDAEVLDFSGPYEVLATARRLMGRENNVILVAERDDVVHARGGYPVMPQASFDQCPHLDVLIVVGGDHTREIEKPQVIDWIRERGLKATLLASVCTGAFLLARARLLDGLQVTTHHEDLADLQAQFPELHVVDNVRWVEQGRVITSGGISAGIDMSLQLVSRLAGPEMAERVARQMEYRWVRNPADGRF